MSTINMTDTDPGEGSPLASDNFTAVYGGTSILDMFYPVGTYYETSDTSFDPNVTWGGVWNEDTSGKMLVAQDSDTFSTIGDTGGAETNTHQHWIPLGADSGNIYGLTVDNSHSVTGLSSRVKSGYRVFVTGTGQNTTTREHTSYNETIDIMNPYIVVKRWHRVA